MEIVNCTSLLSTVRLYSERTGIPRKDAEETGLPLYLWREDVPAGLITKTHCAKAKCPIGEDENPVAYFLSRSNHGYIPLYKRDELNIKNFK